MNYTLALLCLFCGLGAVTLIAILGSIASRKLGFKYAYFIIPSSAVYILLAIISSSKHSLYTTLLINAIVGFYDGTIGFKLSIILKANTGLNDEQRIKYQNSSMGLMMSSIAILLGLIGYAIS
jgi:hypothetical protein